MLQTIDLRSDTITQPDQAMLHYMMACQVGDDIYGEDPEANRLQAQIAALFAKEASLYVPTGTMANLISLMIYQNNGGEVIMDKDSHPLHYESGGMARIAGLQPAFAPSNHGIIEAEKIPGLIRKQIFYMPETRLIWLENTHNRGGGTVYPLESLARIKQIADTHGLPIHMDGARLLNACVCLNCAPTEISRHVTSLSLCFSKGLGCPMGSILAGPRTFIEHALVYRKMLGGAMRQIGYMAGSAVFALREYHRQMEEDHVKAQRIFHLLMAEAPGTAFYGGTNIVLWTLSSTQAADQIIKRLQGQNLRLGLSRPDTIRFVTSRAQSLQDIDDALSRIKGLIKELKE